MVTVGELTEGYTDSLDEGVFGYNGRLNIFPQYQRRYVYSDQQQDAVVDTVLRGLPLGPMHWAVREEAGYEIIDGKQRSLAVCRYVNNEFAIQEHSFRDLSVDDQDRILGYQLMVYLCSGSGQEKLEWFRRISVRGNTPTDQELRNAAYYGPWLEDAKRRFSKPAGPADVLAGDLLHGHPDRNDYLETAIHWISDGDVEHYMSEHWQDQNADDLWLHFQKVVAWVRMHFPKPRTELRGLPWGALYRAYKDQPECAPLVTREVKAFISRQSSTNGLCDTEGLGAPEEQTAIEVRDSSPAATPGMDQTGGQAFEDPFSTMCGDLLRRAQQTHNSIWLEEIGEDLTGPQFTILKVLDTWPAIAQRRLSSLASLDKSTTADIVARLVGRGLLNRRRAPEDGRRDIVVLSKKAAELVSSLTPNVARVQARFLKPLSTKQRDAIIRQLSIIGDVDNSQDSGQAVSHFRAPGHLVRRALQVHTALFAEEFGRDLTAPQYATLTALSTHSALSQRELAERAALSVSTAADIVNRLVRRGWIVRYQDPQDRRRRVLALTLAADHMQHFSSRVTSVQKQLLEPLPIEEHADFLSMLGRIAFAED